MARKPRTLAQVVCRARRAPFDAACNDVRRSLSRLVELLPNNAAAREVLDHVEDALTAARRSLAPVDKKSST